MHEQIVSFRCGRLNTHAVRFDQSAQRRVKRHSFGAAKHSDDFPLAPALGDRISHKIRRTSLASGTIQLVVNHRCHHHYTDKTIGHQVSLLLYKQIN